MRRFNHIDGVAPYNGTVAFVENSVVLTAAERTSPAVVRIEEACRRAFELVGGLAPIRIDCRAGAGGDESEFRIFDLNMKPNMTGAGRPGREDQESLSAIAARGLGWSYADLLKRMLASAWKRD